MTSFNTRSNPYLFAIQREALHRELIPKHPDSPTVEEKRAIKNAVDALHHLSEKMKPVDDYRCPLTPETVKKFWNEGILDWLWFLFDHYKPSSQERWEAISYVHCVLVNFIGIEPRLMLEEQCFSLSESLWADRMYDHQQSEYSRVHGWWESFLSYLFAGQGRIDKGHMKYKTTHTLLLAQKSGSTINLALERLHASFTYASTTSEMEFTLLTSALVKLVPSHRGSEWQNHCFVQGLCNLIRRIITEVLPSSHSQIMAKTCYLLFFALTQKLHNSHSVDTILVAIKHGLFENVAKFSKYLDYDLGVFGVNMEVMNNKALLSILTNLMPTYMKYVSVHNALLPVIENEEYTKEVRGMQTEVPWNMVRSQYQDTASIFNHSPFPFIILCDNLMHDLRILPMKLYGCSGCEYTLYCSKRCQRQHWNNGHRAQCTNARKNPSPYRPLRIRDHVSLLCTVVFVAQELWDSPAEEESRTRCPAIFIDYATTDPKGPCFAELRDEEAMKVASVVPNATVIQCRVSLCQKSMAKLTIAGDIDNRKTGVWFGGRSLTTYEPMLLNPISIPKTDFDSTFGVM